ncbi:MAG: patatin family protein [Ruminococcaceae bacterium]|nr:patatin family protein [Oscillospiraceae bacterium]
MRKGLILEGGAMRGLFTAGILDVMMENGIVYDGIVGVSAGAVFGCNYKSKQIGRVVRYNMKYCQDKRYCSIRSLLRTGNLYGADFCYRELPETLDIFDIKTYRENPVVFYAVCTDAETGKAVYRRIDRGNGEDLLWLRASASMPFVSRPVKIDGRFFLDGALADSIPLRFFEGIGYDKNVVVLTQPDSYRKPAHRSTRLLRHFIRRFPGLTEALSARPAMYNETVQYIRRQEEKGAAFVFRPAESLDVGHMEKDPEKLHKVYLEGRRTAERRLGELKAYLEIQ